MKNRLFMAMALSAVCSSGQAACLSGSVDNYSGSLDGLWCNGNCRLLTLDVGAPVTPYVFQHKGAALSSCELTVTDAREAIFVDTFKRYRNAFSLTSFDDLQILTLDTTQPRPLEVAADGSMVVYLADALDTGTFTPPTCPEETVFDVPANGSTISFYPDFICSADPNGTPIDPASVNFRVYPTHGQIDPIFGGYRYQPPNSMENLDFDEMLFTLESEDGQQSNVAKIRFNFPPG